MKDTEFLGRYVEWKKLSAEQEMDAKEALELIPKAPKPAGMEESRYHLWLAVTTFLCRRIKPPYAYDLRKPGAPLGDETDHGYIVRLVRSPRGHLPGTLCAVELCVSEWDEEPQEYFDAKLQLQLYEDWFGFTTLPKEEAGGRKGVRVPFVRDSVRFENELRPALAKTLRIDRLADEVLGIHTAARRSTKREPASPRYWESKHLEAKAQSLEARAQNLLARLQNLEVQGSEVLASLQRQVRELIGNRPRDADKLASWLQDAERHLRAGQQVSEAWEARSAEREAELQAARVLAAQEEERRRAEAEQQQQAREQQRLELWNKALRLQADAVKVGIPRDRWPVELRKDLPEAIPDSECVGNTTSEQIERLTEVLLAAEKAWYRFLLEELQRNHPWKKK